MNLEELELKVNQESRIQLSDTQLLLKMVEESSELSSGICKFLNKPNLDPYIFLEEIVDVQLLINQFLFNNPNLKQQLDEIKKDKLEKVSTRMGLTVWP